MQPKDRICLALDVPNLAKARRLVEELKDHVGVYKVGKELFTAVGPQIVREINNLGGKVFLDLKYHDIPNTAAKAAEAATELGVYMFNIHASGGFEMMEAVAEAVRNKAMLLGKQRPLVIAVTVLTSIDQEGTGFGYDYEVLRKIVNIARVPVIASGGAGKYEHFVKGIIDGNASAVSTANLFNFMCDGLTEARETLRDNDVKMASWDFGFGSVENAKL